MNVSDHSKPYLVQCIFNSWFLCGSVLFMNSSDPSSKYDPLRICFSLSWRMSKACVSWFWGNASSHVLLILVASGVQRFSYTNEHIFTFDEQQVNFKQVSIISEFCINCLTNPVSSALHELCALASLANFIQSHLHRLFLVYIKTSNCRISDVFHHIFCCWQ